MTVLFLVLPLTIVLSGLAVGAFIWATRHGQLDDLQTPAVRILHDDTCAHEASHKPSSD